MNAKILAAGAALAILAASSAYASPAAHPDRGKTVPPPGQPIPYAQLDAYLKASPKQRQQILANASSATMQSDASTTAPASAAAPAPGASSSTSAATDSTAPTGAPAGTTDAGAGMQSGAVNPAPATPPATDSTAPAGGGASTDKQ